MSVLVHHVSVDLPPLEAGDKPRVYRLAGMGPGVRAYFVAILKERAWRELDSQLGTITTARYRSLEASTFQAMAAGKYEWDEEIHQSIDGSKSGFTATLLARLRMGTGIPDLAEDTVAELLEKYGYERLTKLMLQADGPPPKNDQPPAAGQSAGADSPTNS